MILINDHKENFLRVDHKNGNSGPLQLEGRNQRKKPETQKQTFFFFFLYFINFYFFFYISKISTYQKQTYAKGHNKQFCFHQTGITLITCMSFHLVNIYPETLLLKPVRSLWTHWNME